MYVGSRGTVESDLEPKVAVNHDGIGGPVIRLEIICTQDQIPKKRYGDKSRSGTWKL